MVDRAIRIFLLSACASIATVAPALAQKMHYLGIAASNRQTVFANEAAGAGSTVARTWPVASSNVVSSGGFGGVTLGAVNAAIRQTAERMDRERDVLFLLVTSHGGPNGGGVELSGGGAMRAGQLRGMLDQAGVKNRVVVISACYSGQFVGPLAGPNTAIITAANATNPSFGCSNKRSYTYFGDALFNHGIAQRGRDLRGAFAVARATVTQWERADGERPSQPQMSMGGGLARLLQGMR